MKILALHLPAFHRIPENDEWRGDGFTEWDNVKKGKPLYKNHIQPLVPLNNNYYDLTHIDVLKRQFSIANEFGVDGFVFYHYWFKGHKLFEKPLENLLKEKNIKSEYCLCWANETWSRTWEGNNRDILIKQDYGTYDDWINHIKYLFNFFKDDRYIKINGHPVLFVYSVNQIPDCDKMFKARNTYLNNLGLNDIYLIEFLRAKNSKPASVCSKGVIEFEPMYTIRYDLSIFEKGKRFICKKAGLIDFQNYDKVWKKILKRKKYYPSKILFKSCFVAWDNSPRKGKKNSIILKGATPQKFGKYFLRLLESRRKGASNDIVIINAWNEWGEGAILEPTKQFGYSYLNELKNAIDIFKNEGK